MNELPVYYHIPKCSGTHISNLNNICMRIYYRNKVENWDNRVCNKIRVMVDKKRFFHLFGLIPLTEKKEPIIFNGAPERNTAIYDLQHIKTLIENKTITIFSAVVEPMISPDLSWSINAIRLLCNKLDKETFFYTCFRDPFSRIYSEFNYLKSTISEHEPSHGAYDNLNSFEDYIDSDSFTDSWLIRSITGIDDNTHIDKNVFDNAVSLLNNFLIFDISNSTNSTINILSYIYNLNKQEILNDKDLYFGQNKQKYEKLKLKDMALEYQDKFLHKTYWDNKLYKYFINND